ncbi:MAG: carbonate dehydratase [Burkholderiales bacterium]
MTALSNLFENNRRWAQAMTKAQPDFFSELTKQQTPKYLWIGCSDSRVPANQIVGLPPGELFVHRNVANLVIHTDLNCLSVLQYALDVLKVEHVIVTGHYGCGGIAAAWRDSSHGLIDNWLRHIQDLRDRHRALLWTASSHAEAIDCLCELNVIEQALNVCRTTVVEDAWRRGQKVTVHAWVYSVADGLLRDLNFSISDPADTDRIFNQALASLPSVLTSQR